MNKQNHTSDMAISLTADKAIVLFEFLFRFIYSGNLAIVDQTEESALSSLLARFEEQLVSPFQNDNGDQTAGGGQQCDCHEKGVERSGESHARPLYAV